MFPTAQRMAEKYRCALRGMAVAFRQDDSFRIHLPAAVIVAAVAVWLRVSFVEGLLLVLCVAAVMAAELFNTAIERLAKTITTEEHPEVRDALDVAGGAVLVVAIAAKVVGVAIFAYCLFG